ERNRNEPSPEQLKVVANYQSKHRSRSRPQARFRLEKSTPPRLHSKQDIKARIEIEVAEVDISARLKILVNEGKGRPGTHIWRPVAAFCRPRKAVHTFQVQRNKVRHLSECKLGAWTEENARTENGTHLRMHAEHEKLGIKCSSGSYPEPPASGFTP